MDLPFTPEQFFAVFVQYHEAVGMAPLVLLAVALAAAGLLFRPGAAADRMIAGALCLLWAWMAVVYHFVFFSRINPAAWLFGAAFLLGSLAFGWFGVVQSRLRFRRVAGARGIAGTTLIVFALALYPAIGYGLGHRYPAAPSFGLPCPTTIFTLGLLLFAAHPLPRVVFVVPLLWSAIGSLAALQLGVHEDLALPAAGLVAVAALAGTAQH